METECENTKEPLQAKCDAERPEPWTEIEPGRFQPKRTRGSHLGRELG